MWSAPAIAVGGFVLSFLSPGLTEAVDSSWERLLLAAALMGAGTFFGQGCTSGNGVNGLSSLSPASFVNVLCFMVSGAVTAVLTGTLSSAAATVAASKQAAAEGTPWWLGLVAVAGAAIQTLASKRPVIADIGVGFACAASMLLSGMVRPTRVAGFLDVTSEQGWDPTLMFVMAGAIGVALPIYQVLGVAKGAPEHVRNWASRPISLSLIFGGICFGVGWGLCGMCPIPALTSLSTGNPKVAVFVAGLYASHEAARRMTMALKKKSDK